MTFYLTLLLSVIMSWRNMKCIRLFLPHDMTIQSPAQHALGDRSMCNLQAAAEDYLFGCLLQSFSYTNENIQILLLRWWGAPWSNSPRPLPFNKPYSTHSLYLFLNSGVNGNRIGSENLTAILTSDLGGDVQERHQTSI